jgi:hypothetical protein
MSVPSPWQTYVITIVGENDSTVVDWVADERDYGTVLEIAQASELAADYVSKPYIRIERRDSG